MSPMGLTREAQALGPELTRLRRHLHRHPELSGQERETCRFIGAELGRLGLEPRELLEGTAVVADIEGRDQQAGALLLRADIDALPIQERGEGRDYLSEVAGVMHACGHDGHTAILLGVARLLRDHRDSFSGTVRLAFQPGEENASGAAKMIAAGVLESPHVGAALGLHLWSGEPVGHVGVRDGAIFASADEFHLTVLGRGGHGALPHQALDPVPIASLVVLALQTLVSRETSPLDSAVVTIGQFQAGQAFNIIPESARLSGTLRCFSEESRQRLLGRIEQVAQGIAGAFTASATMELAAGCPPVVSDPAMADLVRRAVRECPQARLVAPEPLTVGDDVARFLEVVPGCYFLVGAGDPSRGMVAPHHHPEFDIAEECLPLGAEVMARAALLHLGARAVA